MINALKNWQLSSAAMLFIVILLEGYVVLSAELLAIRQSIPYTGSGTDTVSIIIAAVLMPLAFGYFHASNLKPGLHSDGRYISVRDRLLKNLFISLCIFVVGLSHPFITLFYTTLIEYGTTNRIALVTIYSVCFLVYPVFLLGQTIPLVSYYFSKEKLNEITGRILFFSTIGSFLGAVFSTLVLMSTIGVNNTVNVIFITLTFLIILLSRGRLSGFSMKAIVITIIGIGLNSGHVMRSFNIVENNKYNTIQVYYDGDDRYMVMNNNNSSMYNPKTGRKHDYINFMEKVTIKSLPDDAAPIRILVIGTGAFTFGAEDTKNQYHFLDIDEAVLNISEDYILERKLSDNKIFHAVPARAYLAQTENKYDLIILDAYQGDLTLPEHLVTQQFFQQVRSRLADHGVVVGNFILSPNYANSYNRKLDNTFRSVFPYSLRYNISKNYGLWNRSKYALANTVYMYSHHPDEEDDLGKVYTDNKNRVFFDKPHSR